MAVPFLHSSEGERRTINPDLWHACAGPRVSMPAVGSLVVYFPQGHSEQVAALTQKEVDGQIPNYPNLQSHLFCQLHNVALHADQETDEVFAQMTLQPVNEQDKDPFLPPDLSLQNRQPTDFFCKTLTASDTSTHGGFSVPRRAAEKVFPPLDFQKQPPAQEIVARDLHNQIWRFRHIYRGQPKRHLLTTGWSVFVSAKRLVAGDSVLFIRDEKGQLLLGIRRANRQQTVMPSSVLSSDSMHIGVLAAAAHAAATSSRFQVFYNPRASPSEFVIPLAKFKKAVYCTQVSVGMRFRMVFETEESTLRRYMGTITGSGDLDPERWPGSKWRNLEVGWDESSAGERPRRVSVWEIEPVSTPFLICPPPFSMRLKRPSHPGLLGDEGDMDGNMKRCLTWLRGENSNRDAQNCTFQNLGGDTSWTRLQRAELAQPDFYNAIPGNTFQEFKSIDASKFLQQQSQQMQFRLLQQRQQPLLQQEQQQQHILWPQSNVHQQQVFQNHHHQQQHQLPALQAQAQAQPQPQTQPQPQPPQLQTQPQPQSQRPPLATPQPMPQQSLPLPQPHLQSPLSNQHHYPNYHQQQQLLVQPTPLPQPQQSLFQTQQQVMQKSDVPAHLLQLSSSRPQASLSLPGSNLPVSMKPCTMFSESELAFGSPASVIANAFSLQGMVGRSHVGTLTSDDNGQLSSLIRSNQCILQQPPLPSQQQSQGALPVPSSLAQIETQITGSWFPSARESSISESPVPSNMQIGQSDSSSTITSCSFSLPPESLGQTGFASLPLQSSSFAFRESSQDEEVQADTCSQMMFGVNKDNPLVLPSTSGSFQLRNANINKDMNGRTMSGNMTGSISSPSGSFTAATPDVPMNHGMVTNGGLDEALLQRGCNWPQMPATVRTFTKVHKSGSVGRSIDVSRLKNYDELRRELARMFNIEGQLEDPQRSCWQLVFVDNENDVLLVGDDPWDEFVSCVRVIKILSPAQVLQMNHESLEPLGSLPIQQQQSSSSEDCQVWKDTRDRVAGVGSVDHGTN